VDAEQIMGLVGLVTALVIAVGALARAKRWEKRERQIKPPEAQHERRPTGFGGPWGD
jgi:hypothetical protein